MNYYSLFIHVLKGILVTSGLGQIILIFPKHLHISWFSETVSLLISGVNS
jgi:hypothetical protein